ncbi:MAG: transglutaminase-like domain-containing protein [Planctomycetes bacterium]|nr:transglutaminase-like domain-containing protein [Planctomycetota bacterium]
MLPTRSIRNPPPSWPRAGRAVALITIALVAGIGYVTTRPPLGRESAYVRLAPADSDDIETIYGAMRWELDAILDVGAWSDRFAPEARTAAVTSVLDRLGDRTGLALVRALVRHDATRIRGASLLHRPRDDAETGHPLAWRYRERATPEADAAFLAVARDRELHIQTRIPAFVALCRPGNTASLDALVDVALDMDDDEDVRRELIVRLPRIGGRAPLRLRELLYVPFDRLDHTAAVTLAAMGDMESPTHVLRTLRSGTRPRSPLGWQHYHEFQLALDGICRAVERSDPDLVRHIDAVRAVTNAVGVPESSAALETTAAAIGEVADRFDAWLNLHPDARSTAWERARLDPAETARRHAWMQLRTLEHIAAAADAEIDVASATESLRERSDEYAAIVLEDVDRVARWLRPRLAACRTPRETLDRMQALLVPRRTSRPYGIDESDITSPLILRAGNCMGWTVLFVALGDRLGLPLHAVEVPRHVFVRWDDGTTRVNFDPSNGGVVLTDDEYARTYGVTPALAASGQYLRNLTRKELVSLALTNHASHTLSIEGLGNQLAPFAARVADTSARLHPRNLYAWLILAAASARLGDAGKADLLRAASAAEALPEFTPAYATRLASSLATAHLGDEALALLDRHPDIGAESRHVRALALCSLSRFADARRISMDLAAGGGTDEAAFDAAVAFAVSPAIGWAALDAVLLRAEDDGSGLPRWARPGAGLARSEVTLAVAGHVLDDGPPSDTSARLAIAIAERLLSDPRLRSAGRSSDVETRRDDIRARAFERLGDPARAQAIRDELKKSWDR